MCRTRSDEALHRDKDVPCEACRRAKNELRCAMIGFFALISERPNLIDFSQVDFYTRSTVDR